MGIQLPPELADVAAEAGVSWPEADEDRMRTAAAAWRDAGTRLTTLTRDADHAAQGALNAVTGDAGNAARRHWSTFVAPDTGHLTASAHGCNVAANRLEHAADQVGAAKVEIVRNLVTLAKNKDAAHSAANAGHPTALLGLDTAVRGTAANVTNITNNLVTAVQPASGVDISAVPSVVNANPGTHGPLAAVVDPAVQAVAGPGGHGHGSGPLAPVAGVVDPVVQVVTEPGAHGPVVDPVAGPGGHGHGSGPLAPAAGVVDSVAQVITDPGPRHPDSTGPVRIDLPTPPAGQTVQAGLAPGGVLDPAAPAQVPQSPGGAPGQGAGPNPGVGPSPGGAGPVGGGGGPAPAPSGPGGGAIPGPAGGRPIVGGVVPAPAGPGGAIPTQGGPGAVPGAGPGAGAGRPALGGGVQAPEESGAKPGLARGPLTNAVPPGAMVAPITQATPAPVGPPPPKPEDAAMLFWVHMFPIGHMPVVSDRPARQLPPPPEELDYAPGLRFEPGDHPQHHLIRATMSEPATAHALPADHPRVEALVEGYDPLGGQHERDWDRRFLVRLGSVTPHGISSEGKEYAWPPGESYPEGGSAPGDPELLAEGTIIDRFGSPGGRVFSADATPFARRSLPPDALYAGYHRYRVERPLPVHRTISAPWFGQPGGGERYRSTYTAEELIAFGYLTELTGGEQ
jgi:hypothetical protein